MVHVRYICIACGSTPCVYDDNNRLVVTIPTDCPRKCVYCEWKRVDEDVRV